MGTRKLVSKETSLLAQDYRGRTGEIWWKEHTTRLHFGSDLKPGGIATLVGRLGDATECAPGVDTVVYTAATDTVRVIRLSAHAEGYETGVTDFPDVQGCDIMAVKNLRLGTGDASVYGVTYTSVNPLVTYAADVVDGKLVVTATPVSLVNTVTVNTVAFEIETGA